MRIGIGFSTPRTRNPLSWLVRKITRSEASHCFLVCDPSTGPVMVRECHLDFRDVPLGRFRESNHVLDIHWLTWPEATEAYHQTDDWLGVTYDFEGLAGELVVYLGRWLKKKWHNPVTGSKALFCSEAVVRFLQLARYPSADLLDPDDASPQDLLEWCRAFVR